MWPGSSKHFEENSCSIFRTRCRSTSGNDIVPSTDCADNDIGNAYQTVDLLSDAQKYNFLCHTLLCHHWKPSMTYSFQPNLSGQKFQYLVNMSPPPWVAYSNALDGAFCVNCVLFGGEGGHNASKLLHLFWSPLNNCNTALQRLDQHASKPLHYTTATLKATHFRSCM